MVSEETKNSPDINSSNLNNACSDTETDESDSKKNSKIIHNLAIRPYLERQNDTLLIKKRHEHVNSSSSSLSDEEDETQDLIINDDDTTCSSFKINKFKNSRFIDKSKKYKASLVRKAFGKQPYHYQPKTVKDVEDKSNLVLL